MGYTGSARLLAPLVARAKGLWGAKGIVLGPILFVLFINDLLSTIKHGCRFSFADGTKLIGGIQELSSVNHLQDDLN